MTKYVVEPRRHSQMTLGLLLKWYLGAGILGTVAIVVSAAIFGLMSSDAKPETFLLYFLPIAAICFAAMIYVWHHHIHPRIKAYREHDISEFESLVGRKYES
jgi:hypothetical protein